jgi:hypothetical protein
MVNIADVCRCMGGCQRFPRCREQRMGMVGGCGGDQAYGGPCFQLCPEGVGSSRTMGEGSGCMKRSVVPGLR